MLTPPKAMIFAGKDEVERLPDAKTIAGLRCHAFKFGDSREAAALWLTYELPLGRDHVNLINKVLRIDLALGGEAGELLQEFQWLTEKESQKLTPEKKAKVEEEIADVLIYLVRLCHKLEIDPIMAAKDKIVKNTQKYPVHSAKGNARKYTEVQNDNL